MNTIRVTYEYKGKVETANSFCGDDVKSIREAFATALKYESGVGDEDYFAWDNPEVLEHKILKIELIQE